jgi:hypothetical protein
MAEDQRNNFSFSLLQLEQCPVETRPGMCGTTRDVNIPEPRQRYGFAVLPLVIHDSPCVPFNGGPREP